MEKRLRMSCILIAQLDVFWHLNKWISKSLFSKWKMGWCLFWFFLIEKRKKERGKRRKERKFTGVTVSMEVRRTQSHSMSSSQSRMHSQSLKFQSEKNHSFLYICEIQCWGKNRSHSEICSLHSAVRHRPFNRARVRWNFEPKPYPARKALLWGISPTCDCTLAPTWDPW